MVLVTINCEWVMIIFLPSFEFILPILPHTCCVNLFLIAKLRYVYFFQNNLLDWWWNLRWKWLKSKSQINASTRAWGFCTLLFILFVFITIYICRQRQLYCLVATSTLVNVILLLYLHSGLPDLTLKEL